MKILWVFNHPAPYKINFFNELGKNVELTVLFECNLEKDRDPAFYYGGAKGFSAVFLNARQIGKANNWSRKIVEYIKKNKHDVVVMNGYSTFSEMMAIDYLKRKKIPYVLAINGGIVRPEEKPFHLKIKKHYISGASLYLAPDDVSAAYLVHYGADETKIRLYPYSTIFTKEIPSFPIDQQEKASLRKKYGLKCERLYIAAGQFILRKNNENLIRRWAKEPTNRTLLIIGAGPEKESYQDAIDKLGLKNVFIKEYLPHDVLLRYIRMADATIFLTKEDIYGHITNESLSQGTPVIANRNSNSALHLIRNEVNGMLINDSDEKEFLAAIDHSWTLLNRDACLETARANTIEKMVECHLRLFKEYLHK
jgi:hypothetical protein